MGELGMVGGVLWIELEVVVSDELDLQGCECCELLVSVNFGQLLCFLCKVVFGGELVCISLVIEVVMFGKDSVGIMVFDEVDIGIGGVVVEVVGQKLCVFGVM